MKNEVYRLTLDHFIDYGGECMQLEKPIVVQMICNMNYAPSAVCLNSMLESMRDEVLKRATKGAQDD